LSTVDAQAGRQAAGVQMFLYVIDVKQEYGVIYKSTAPASTGFLFHLRTNSRQNGDRDLYAIQHSA
jgi:hypothetical protein